MTVSDLGLTPSQHAELAHHDAEFVAEWLEATIAQGNAIKSQAGWFLAGVRSGRRPEETRDAAKAKATDLAERYIRNAGLYHPSEEDILDECFGQHGRLKQWADDDALRNRIGRLWRREQPRARAAHEAFLERARANTPTVQPESWIRTTGWLRDDVAQELVELYPNLAAGEYTRLLELAADITKHELSA